MLDELNLWWEQTKKKRESREEKRREEKRSGNKKKKKKKELPMQDGNEIGQLQGWGRGRGRQPKERSNWLNVEQTKKKEQQIDKLQHINLLICCWIF